MLWRMLVLANAATDLVRERWARAIGFGLQRETEAYPDGVSNLELSERRERLDDVLREQRGLLEPVTMQFVRGPLLSIVADRDGVILSARSDRTVVDPMARLRLIEGARWGEETRGTNAIGTALVEGNAVGVVGEAHFEVRNRELFCYATPVRDAYGELVAVLDVTGPMHSHDPAIGSAVQGAGVALERALRAVCYADRGRGTFEAIERLVHKSIGATILIEASGALRAVNAAARRELQLGERSVVTCERLFGMSFHELVHTASGRDGMRFETRDGAWQIGVDPLTGTGNRTLAALVHFERERDGCSSSAAAPEPAPRPPSAAEFSNILGQAPAVLEAKRLAERLARTPLPVLLLAETGTGKELFARAIHAASAVRDQAFVAVNCAALSPELMLSEFFGYAPGAFTGAARHGSEGRLAAAHGGTLFLDEIAEMSDALQAALLRVLDNGVYQRVGDNRENRADFRLICATCRDLPGLVASGKFRSDLFYRIQGGNVTIPALRDRTDAVWLAERLLEQLAPGSASRLSEEVKQFVREHHWPGNVRELKTAMAHAVALAAGEPLILREHLPVVLDTRAFDSGATHPAGPAALTRERIVRDAIETTLRACAGNVSEAARRLGIGRGSVYRALRGSESTRRRSGR